MLLEALLSLEQGQFSPAPPIVAEDGDRRCVICGIAFSDFLVFKLAWAVETAEKIQAQRTAYLQSLLKIA